MVSLSEKRIYFTRHAQAEHNVAEDYSIPDAPLTALGRQQSQKLNEDTKDSFQKTADLLVTSGLRRTLSTTIVGYPELRKRLESEGKPVIVLPQLQESNAHPCDRGSDRALLETDPEFTGLDLSLLTPDWNKKEGFYAPDAASLKNRGKWIRKWLRDRPEKDIVVVSHGDCLRYTTEGWNSGNPWANTEVRIFKFKNGENDEDAELEFVEQGVKEGKNEPTSTDLKN